MFLEGRIGARALLLAAMPLLGLPATVTFAQNGAAAPASQVSTPDPNLFKGSTTGITSGTVIRTVGALVIVVAMGIGALVLFKRVFPQISGAGSRSIKIQETALLGPRKYLHVVEVSNQRLLLGSTNDRITMLAHLVDDLSRLEFERDEEREVG